MDTPDNVLGPFLDMHSVNTPSRWSSRARDGVPWTELSLPCARAVRTVLILTGRKLLTGHGFLSGTREFLAVSVWVWLLLPVLSN